MTRIATPENEEFLLMMAKHGTASHMDKLVRKFIHAKSSWSEFSQKTDLVIEPEDQPSLLCYQVGNGQYVIHGRLPEEAGAILLKALDSFVEVIKEENKEELQDDTQDQHQQENASAEAPCIATTDSSEEKSNNASAEAFFDPSDKTQPTCSITANRGSALVYLAEHALSTMAKDVKQGSSGDRYQLMLHINANPDHPDCKITGPCSYLEGDRYLPLKVAKRLSCDSSLRLVTEDDEGNVLNIGRKSRIIPQAIKLAVQMRDGGCQFPSCWQTKWTDQHHIQHWADGGETSLSNLTTLCRFHHGLVHKGDFRIEIGENRELLFIESKHRLPMLPMPIQFPNAPGYQQTLSAWKQDEQASDIHITPETAVTRWLGDQVDYGQAVDGLFSME